MASQQRRSVWWAADILSGTGISTMAESSLRWEKRKIAMGKLNVESEQTRKHFVLLDRKNGGFCVRGEVAAGPLRAG